MYAVAEGSRAEVFHGTAKHTPGGLVKKDLVQDKYGNIKSRAAVAAAKKRMKKEGTSAMVRVGSGKLVIVCLTLPQCFAPRMWSLRSLQGKL